MDLYLANSTELWHHGVKGQKWGIKNGPPYPLETSRKSGIVEDAISSGKVSAKINREKQLRHTKSDHASGKSYLYGDLDFAQKLIDRYSGAGEPVMSNGVWKNKERVTTPSKVGIYIDANGRRTESNSVMIIYSKTGTHLYPIGEESD